MGGGRALTLIRGYTDTILLMVNLEFWTKAKWSLNPVALPSPELVKYRRVNVVEENEVIELA